MTPALLLLALLPAQVGRLGPGDHCRSLCVCEQQRSYLVHVPPCYDGIRPLPVVLIYHGAKTNAEHMTKFCGLNAKADQAGFIAVYPNGTGHVSKVLTFNAGNCCGCAVRKQVDDVAFTRALLDELAQLLNVDAKRVYAAGMSNGGMMAHLLALEMPDRIAAIAAVSGPLGVVPCGPRQPVPVLHFHGNHDIFVPYKGGVGWGNDFRTRFQSVEQTIQTWIGINGCPQTPREVVCIPDHARDGTRVIQETYGPGRDGAEVVLVTIAGGGHNWPGQPQPLPVGLYIGRSTRNICANDMMWEFFQKHPHK